MNWKLLYGMELEENKALRVQNQMQRQEIETLKYLLTKQEEKKKDESKTVEQHTTINIRYSYM